MLLYLPQKYLQLPTTEPNRIEKASPLPSWKLYRTVVFKSEQIIDCLNFLIDTEVQSAL